MNKVVKRSVFFLFVLMFGFLSFGQNKPDFIEIKKNIEDKKSPYFYERLLFKFRGMPQAIDSAEAFHLYYGKRFTAHKLSPFGTDFQKFGEKFQQSKFDDAIKLGEDLHFKDPSNLEVLLLLLQCYENVQNQNKFMLTLQKFRMVSATVLASGAGNTPDSPYLVNTVGEEYVLLNLLKIPFHDYQRSSQASQDGMMDVWGNGKENIYINVVGYAPE